MVFLITIFYSLKNVELTPGVYRPVQRGADHHRVRALVGGCQHNADGACQRPGRVDCILPRLLDIDHTHPQISGQDQR